MSRITRFGSLIAILFCLMGCSPERKQSSDQNSSGLVHYAQGFSISGKDVNNLKITVRNPWQHAQNVQFTYFLSDTIKTSYIKDQFTTYIKTPVKRVICLSTTHIGFIGSLQQEESVCGVSGKGYVVNKKIRKHIAENKVFDVGYDENLNYELILQLKPDLVFAYGVSVSVTNMIRKLTELKIPVIMIGEYLEEKPLAKMEWLKIFGACFGSWDMAVSKFDSAEIRYNRLSKQAMQEKNKPKVLLGLPWMGNWYVSGSKSYIARLIEDAGGKYIWDHLNFNESRPIALEKIYERALTAEYWLNPGEARSVKEIIHVDPRFSGLPPVTQKNIFNNDNQLIPSGGNDFYEAGGVEPDLILADIISILHPQLLPSHQLKYYRKLN